MTKNKEYLKKWRASESGKASVKRYRDKTKAQRAIKAKEYYKKNKVKILKKSSEYNKLHPEVIKKSQDKNRQKNILRGRKDRQELKPAYVNDLIRASKKTETILGASAVVVVVGRIKRIISNATNTKICNNCQDVLPKSNFRVHGKKKDGSNIYSANCNKCHSIIRKKYVTEKTIQDKRAAAKRWYLKIKKKYF